MRTITFKLLTNTTTTTESVYGQAFAQDDNATELVFDFTGTDVATWDKWLDLSMSDMTKDTQSLGTDAIVRFRLGPEHTKRGDLRINPYAKSGTSRTGFPIQVLKVERQLNNSVVDASATQSMIDYFNVALAVKEVTTTTLPAGSQASATVTKASDGLTFEFSIPQGESWQGTRFDDLFFPLAQAKQGANLKPDFDFTNNGLLFPQNDTAEYVLITCQLPHRWKEGSTIFPHLHYTQTVNAQPVFRMEYRWTNIGDVVSGLWTNFDLTTNAIAYVSGSIHQILKNATGIAGTGKTISSLLEIKLYRTDNVYTGDLLAKQFDIHIEIDGLGSTAEYVK